MAKAWISYAWSDNETSDVDFVAQELRLMGLNIHLDRWDIKVGLRLWDQIEGWICDPEKSDAWILYATQASLLSEPCREEFNYALNRAISNRGGTFPLIAIFPGAVDGALIPAAIKIRRFVNLTDPEWKERVVAACERRNPAIESQNVLPYDLVEHPPCAASSGKKVLEVRPRAGSWAPFFAGVPIGEKDMTGLSLSHGPRGTVPAMTRLFGSGGTESEDHQWWLQIAHNECTPTQSYFILYDARPSKLAFGPLGSDKTSFWIV